MDISDAFNRHKSVVDNFARKWDQYSSVYDSVDPCKSISKANFKKHLGRRHVCRVNFGELDAPIKEVGAKKNSGAAKAAPGCGTKPPPQQTPPPAYDDLFRPPPPYRTK
ncbi:hypothetical protein ANCDUO_12332 [Ancylostoma duodenale]|uniref:Uncharacterized protein n=1 Tax=Ancylostoma duodenale TaxID=51022 RepID=A0A0C2D5U6_9BILA|nr:hypothetical protein ANCDUO_12332 [Ancylostoma duodenale]